MPRRGEIKPFASAAMDYFRNGWYPLPVRTGSKRVAVDGFTGHEGEWPDEEVIETWIRRYPGSNIALRMPESVTGIDVDAYDGRAGADTLASLEHELCPLPGTFITTSRDDGISGIRLFRVPDSLTWRGNAGPGIDVISWHYRYALVNPSIHPDTGARYAWYRNGREDYSNRIFPERLPDMPVEWIEFLRHDKHDQKSGMLSQSVIRDWIRQFGSAEMCIVMNETARKWAGNIREAGKAGGAHDEMVRGVRAAIGDTHAGHKGLAEALNILWNAFREAVSSRRHPEDMESEWKRAVYGAARIKYENVSDTDPCDEWETGPDSMRFTPRRNSGRKPISSYSDAGLDWLHWPVFPAGTISIIDGDPKYGKSLITISIAAAASHGNPVLPFGESRIDGPASTLFITTEDNPGRVLKPRLKAAGADMDLVFTEEVKLDQHGFPRGISLPNSAPRIRSLVDGCAFCVIDPITSFLEESVNTANDASVRRALAPLSYIAMETGTCFILVRHLNKQSGPKAMYRGGGSIAFSAVARSGLITGELEDGQFGIAHSYSNYAQPFEGVYSYSITGSEEDDSVPVIKWGEHYENTDANDLVASKQRGRPARVRREMEEFLTIMFIEDDTTLTTSELKTAMLERGIVFNSATLTRAAANLGIHARQVFRNGKSHHWVWTNEPEKISMKIIRE